MKHYRYIMTAITLVIVLSGCNLLNGTTKSGNYASTVVEVDTLSNPASFIEVSDVINGEWMIYSINDKRVTGEDNRPYITFEESSLRFYAFNGCNTLNGDYRLGTDNRISFSNVLSTMRSCPDAEYEYEINNAINAARSLSITQVGNEYFMSVFNEAKRGVMVLRKHNMDFLNGTWNVININEMRCDNEDIGMVIDIPQLKIHGNTGCNIFNGTLLIDPDKRNSIMFQQIATTRMACPDGEQEMALLIALEEVESCLRGKNADTVVLYDTDGKQVLVLRRIR